MAGVTGKDYVWKGSFKGDSLSVQFGAAGDASSLGLMQSMNVSFTRAINRIRDLSDPTSVYYVSGVPDGTFQLSAIIGPKGSFGEVIKKMTDPCTPFDVTVSNEGGTCGSGGGSSSSTKIILKQSVATQVGVQISVQDFVMTDSVSGMFTDLDLG